MDEAQVKKLIEAAVAPLQAKLTEAETKLVAAETRSKPLIESALKGEAVAEATVALSGISMREAGKQYVISECIKNIPIKDGKLVPEPRATLYESKGPVRIPSAQVEALLPRPAAR